MRAAWAPWCSYVYIHGISQVPKNLCCGQSYLSYQIFHFTRKSASLHQESWFGFLPTGREVKANTVNSTRHKRAKVTQLKTKRKNENVGLPRSLEENTWENLLSLPEGRNSEWAVGTTAQSQSKELDIPLTNTGVHREKWTWLVRKATPWLLYFAVACMTTNSIRREMPLNGKSFIFLTW